MQDTRFLDLRGQGVLVAIIDSGIDYANEDFRNADGTTRIRALWDQSLISDENEEKNPPKGYRMGVEFTQEQINRALEADFVRGKEKNGTKSGYIRSWDCKLQGLLPEMGEEAEICMPVWRRTVS